MSRTKDRDPVLVEPVLNGFTRFLSAEKLSALGTIAQAAIVTVPEYFTAEDIQADKLPSAEAPFVAAQTVKPELKLPKG